jgi:hypothetical protein
MQVAEKLDWKGLNPLYFKTFCGFHMHVGL